MASNPDPRPGRWVLPIIVVGMVGFTYFFVQALNTSADENGETNGAVATSTTATTEANGENGSTTTEATTTTTLPEAIVAYLEEVSALEDRVGTLATGVNDTNTAWDDRENTGVTYGETEAALEGLEQDAAAIAADAAALPAPPESFGNAAAHGAMVTATADVASSTTAVLAGLRATDTGQARRAALDQFNTAVTSFNEAVVQLNT